MSLTVWVYCFRFLFLLYRIYLFSIGKGDIGVFVCVPCFYYHLRVVLPSDYCICIIGLRVFYTSESFYSINLYGDMNLLTGFAINCPSRMKILSRIMQFMFWEEPILV